MKKFWKKLYFHYIRNIPWRVLNDDEKNINKQIKFEQTILNLLSSKDFKVLKSDLLKPDDNPIFTLPNFLEITWPKGTDGKYFESYQVLQYFETIGMIRFQLNLKNNVSKVFDIKGFDTWNDVLRNCENHITEVLNSTQVQELLAKDYFNVSLQELLNDDIKTIYSLLCENKYIKLHALHFTVTNLDFLKDEYTYELKWDLDPNFVFKQNVKSAYVKLLHLRMQMIKRVLAEQNLINTLSNIDILRLEDKTYLQKYFLDYNKKLLDDNDLSNLIIQNVSFDEYSTHLYFTFYDEQYQITDYLDVVSNVALSNKKFIINIQNVLNTLSFEQEVYNLYLNNELSEEKNTEILQKYGLNDEFELFVKYMSNQYSLIVEIKHKYNHYINSSIQITSHQNFKKDYQDSYLSPSDLYYLTINDLDYLKFVQISILNIKVWKEQNPLDNHNFFNNYDVLWKDRLLENEFDSYFKLDDNNLDNVLIVSDVKGTLYQRSLYLSNISEQLSAKNILNVLVNNKSITDYLKNQNYSFFKNFLSYKNEANNFIKETLIKQFNNNLALINFFKEHDFSINLNENLNAIHIDVLKTTNNDVFLSSNIYIDNALYNDLSNLKRNNAFVDYLRTLDGFFSHDLINEEKIKQYLMDHINGFKITNFEIVKKYDEKNQIAQLSFVFKNLFPELVFDIKQIKQEVNKEQLMNELCHDLIHLIQSNQLVLNKEINEYHLKPHMNLFDQNKYACFLNDDLVLKINEFDSIKDPRIFFELSNNTIHVEILDYCFNSKTLVNVFNDLFATIPEENKVAFKNNLINNKETDFSVLFKDIVLPKWLKQNQLNASLNEQKKVEFVFMQIPLLSY